MGKKKQAKVQQEDSAKIFDSPFAGLERLKSSLPLGESRPAESSPGEVEPTVSATTAGTPRGRIVLQREKKGRAGKTVTRVLGISSADERERLMKQLKKELGCGGVLEGEDIVLLGDVGLRARARLESYGFARVVLGN